MSGAAERSLVHGGGGARARPRHRPEHDGLHLRQRGPHPRPAVRSRRADPLPEQRATSSPTTSSGVSIADLQDWRAQAHTFEGLAAFDEHEMNVSDTGRPAERIGGADVTANTFQLLASGAAPGPRLRAGRGPAGAAPVVILGYSVWKNRYGSDPAILGRAIKINDAPPRSSASCRKACASPPTPICGVHTSRRRRRPRSATIAVSACSAGSRPARRNHRRDRAVGDRGPSSSAISRHQQGSRRRRDDVQRALQRRPDPDRSSWR